MADRLVVVEDSYIYRIQWFLEDGDDMGAILGEGEEARGITIPEMQKKVNELTEEDDRKHWHAVLVIRQMVPRVLSDERGFFWESRRRAEQALRSVRAEWKVNKSGRIWPEWARTALAAGWRPPKGWSP